MLEVEMSRHELMVIMRSLSEGIKEQIFEPQTDFDWSVLR
jgi:hypothetical protein